MVMETVINPELNEHLNSNGQSSQQQHTTNLEELCSLLRNEVPESRQTLLDTQSNLEKVADYCSTAYIESDDKRFAFENTKNYTTHSLASVAYQINTLAFNVLHMLELQTNQISEMESQMNYISQKFQFHNEKVARRKIALLTSAKTMVRQPKVLMPANQEKQSKYIRKPIDFSLLDDIGHGVKISNQSNFLRSLNTTSNSGRMSGVQTLGPKSSMSSLSHYHHYNTLSGGSGPAPTTKPPTPPQAIRSGFGTLSRSSQNKEYRALVPPIAPPQVPKNYESNYPIGHPKSAIIHRQPSITGSTGSGTGGGYATGHHHHQQNNQYMAGYSHYHPGSSAVSLNSNMYGHTTNNNNNNNNQQQINTSLDNNNNNDNNNCPPPPPPPPLPSAQLDPNDSSLPDPPSPSNIQQQQHHHHHSNYDGRNTTASPPLPPPPPTIDNVHHGINHHPMMNKQHSIYGTSSMRQNVPDWVPANYIEKVIAIYDYSADKDDELTFQENSVIYVTRKNDDGWFEGVMNGVLGLFPGNYVEPCL
ncbi:Abl interactor 2 [Dermatophagoides farinae]|uniref:Abl interactor 2 n=2 Tax=Dermatophagoides farinae TaxID=6954 RepID=A0A922I276_DERFA|nr:abl interactor 2-like [Dermatophagoides farinae]KAH9517695.1 Abl interactor 2 [Dermatophagoides farinae]